MNLKWNLKDIPGTRIKCNAWLLTARYLEYAKDLEPCFGPPPLTEGTQNISELCYGVTEGYTGSTVIAQ